jgi:hypothetical protein
MARWEGERVRLGDVIDVLQDRAYGLLMLLLSVPIVIPNPVPGISSIFGLPLILVAAQLAIGRPKPWFPAFLNDRSIRTAEFAAMVARTVPWLRRIEKFLQPRMTFLCTPFVERLSALFCLVMAIILFLPIPLGNMLPAFAVCLIAMGMIEHDGLSVMTGYVTGVASMVVVSAVVGGLVQAAIFFLHKAFGG